MSGGSALYVFIYSIFYFVTKVDSHTLYFLLTSQGLYNPNLSQYSLWVDVAGFLPNLMYHSIVSGLMSQGFYQT